MAVIQTQGLSKYYGRARGIVEVNLSVEQGECFGFIGPNGAGKSTTIRTLLGLIAPSAGSALVLGRDIVKEKTAILRRVGYLPSEATFYPGLRVADILKLSAGLRQKDCTAEADALCQRLRLNPHSRVDELSLGNRKKVGIVCALQSNPELLILDEPTSGLDPLIQKEFFDIIREKNRGGTTVFLSSHILSEIQRNCGRAAVIREGRIIACDSVAHLTRSSARRVTVYGHADLDGLTGLLEPENHGQGVSFLYSGDMNELLRRLACGDVRDLRVAEPDLEDVFLHYYEEGRRL